MAPDRRDGQALPDLAADTDHDHDPHDEAEAAPTIAEPGPVGPEEHKAAAGKLIIREDGKRPRVAGARDLLVLSPRKDPFYCGTPADIAEAEWFARLWAEFGKPGLWIREVHYRASQLGGTLADGSPYPNNKESSRRFAGLPRPPGISASWTRS
jgi:hypothetical protein